MSEKLQLPSATTSSFEFMTLIMTYIEILDLII